MLEKRKALAENYAMSKAIAIINPVIKRKTDALNKSHRIFGRSLILNSLMIKIELTKEKTTSKQHRNKQPVLPYAYIKVPLKFSR
ncbi:hypothetical protein [Flavobacterium panici]|uniref:Uncharacterized protein n=1 Tax=Flavobacterium panici TaxID=2654843 RepID=A0A9N8J1Q5_9FLAO|nr:hypothetical protein [Flavobacterium panici]CAC9973901.1 hypothetical protein FLAPXU55_01592 [Flavobacterium panici]